MPGASSYFLLVEITRPVRASAKPQNPSAMPWHSCGLDLKLLQELTDRCGKHVEDRA